MKTTVIAAAVAALLGAGAVTVIASPASAAVVCNVEGDCWHVDHRQSYPHMRFEQHPDDWYFHQKWDQDKKRHWREYHEGHGYWEHGAWVAR